MLHQLILVVCLATPLLADVFVEERGRQDECENQCVAEYPLHTYPKPEHLTTCERGCRLFSLVQIAKKTDDGREGEEQKKKGCKDACGEAYTDAKDGEKGLEYHCEVGCHHGEAVHDGRKASVEEELRFRDPLLSLLLPQGGQGQGQSGGLFDSRPFQMMQQMMNDMMDQMNQAMSVSWSVFDSEQQQQKQQNNNGDGNKVEVSISGPSRQVFVRKPGSILVVRTSHTGILPSAGGAGSDMEDPFEDLRGSNTRFMDMDGDPFPRIRTAAVVKAEVPKSSDWLECVSRKAGIPRWLLLTSIFLCSLMFVWLCFAATGPMPEQRVYAISPAPPAYACKQPWSEIPYVCPTYEKTVLEAAVAAENEKNVAGDKERLIDNMEDEQEEEEEAQPLPAKIHLEIV